MDDIANQLICSTNPTQGFWVFSIWRLSLFFPFWLYTWVPFSSNAFRYGRSNHEGMIALQLPRGKQIPWCLWLGNIQSSYYSGLWEQGICSFYPSFQLLGCKEQVRVASRVFAIHFVGQHAPIFKVQAFIEMISLHLLHVLLLNPSWILWLEYLNLPWQADPELGHILPRPCLRE